jgi:hypothetical protein
VTEPIVPRASVGEKTVSLALPSLLLPLLLWMWSADRAEATFLMLTIVVYGIVARSLVAHLLLVPWRTRVLLDDAASTSASRLGARCHGETSLRSPRHLPARDWSGD